MDTFIKSWYLVLIAMILLFHQNYAQIYNVTIKPGSSGADAFLASSNGNINYGNHPELGAQAWTCNGNACYARSLIRFDLSTIPANASVVYAELNLFASTNPVNGNGIAMQGQNAANLYVITGNWSESSVTWNSQPFYSLSSAILLPQSTSGNQNYLHTDVTSYIQNMHVNPSSNFGFMLRLANENPYATMTFASSDDPDSTLWPELLVQYILNQPDTCVLLNAGDPLSSDAFLASDAPMNNYGTHPEIAAISWTCQSTPCFARGLLNFDFSQLPQGAVINSAVLNLFANTNPQNGNGIAMQGNNTSVLQRVVSPWTENGVSWFTQPNTTNLNEVYLPQSSSPFQDYTGINITNLVKDLLNNLSGSYGFLLQLLNESGYTTMTFASGDYFQSALHPTLEICFNYPTGYLQLPFVDDKLFSILPNPVTGGVINVKFLKRTSENLQFSVCDLQGRLIHKWSFQSGFIPGESCTLALPEANVCNGVYCLQMQDDLHGIYAVRFILIE